MLVDAVAIDHWSSLERDQILRQRLIEPLGVPILGEALELWKMSLLTPREEAGPAIPPFRRVTARSRCFQSSLSVLNLATGRVSCFITPSTPYRHTATQLPPERLSRRTDPRWYLEDMTGHSRHRQFTHEWMVSLMPGRAIGMLLHSDRENVGIAGGDRCVSD